MAIRALKSRFGTAIRIHRVALQISQEELADRSGLHRTYISDVERGARNPSLESIERLARALKVSVSALFSGVGNGSEVDQTVEILLVEDNADDVDLTVRAFRKAKITNPLHVARDGAEALDFLFATGAHEARQDLPPPGLLLLDLNLPKIGGLEVLRRIKADQRTKEIPVVVLTVSKDERHIAACRRLGVKSYIVKPVGFENFSEVTPALPLEWVLKKPVRGDPGGKGRHETKTG